MTHIDPALIEAAIPYFETRAKVAALLKEAGVKKHAREYVAEVLLDAGVIDLDELAHLAPDEEPEVAASDTLAAEWLDKTAWWNDREGMVVAVDAGGERAMWYSKTGTAQASARRWLPLSWLTHEAPMMTTPEPDDAA